MNQCKLKIRLVFDDIQIAISINESSQHESATHNNVLCSLFMKTGST